MKSQRNYRAPANRRAERERQDRQGYWMIAGCVAVLATVGGAVAANQPAARDKQTGCLKTALAEHQVTAVDRTDPWTAAGQAVLRAAILQQGTMAAPEARLTLLAFDGAAGVTVKPQFDQCKPAQGHQVNSWVNTVSHVDRNYKSAFEAPLAGAIEQLTQVHNAANTNLVDFLATTAGTLQYQSNAKKKRIRLYTDAAEHTPEGSFFASSKRRFDPASFTAYFKERIGDRLKGIELQIVITPSAATLPAVARLIKAAWTQALTASGVTFTWEQL